MVLRYSLWCRLQVYSDCHAPPSDHIHTRAHSQLTAVRWALKDLVDKGSFYSMFISKAKCIYSHQTAWLITAMTRSCPSRLKVKVEMKLECVFLLILWFLGQRINNLIERITVRLVNNKDNPKLQPYAQVSAVLWLWQKSFSLRGTKLILADKPRAKSERLFFWCKQDASQVWLHFGQRYFNCNTITNLY